MRLNYSRKWDGEIQELGRDLSMNISNQQSWLLIRLDDRVTIGYGDGHCSSVIDGHIWRFAVDFEIDSPLLSTLVTFESHPPITNRNAIVGFHLDLLPSQEYEIRFEKKNGSKNRRI